MASPERDPFIDFVRAVSLIVVVLWHWSFTIIVWQGDGPHATNPIGFTRGMYLLTWVLQVLPLFFFVGGYAHQMAWAATRASGRSIGTFVWQRLSALARPALAVILVWWAIGSVVAATLRIEGMSRAVILVLSPLWFLAVYLILIALFPLAQWLHERFDVLVLVWAAGIAVLVDVGRFSRGWDGIGWVNMVVVWALCHQLGFFYPRLVAAPRRVAWALAWGGFFALVATVGSGLYPGSMVGVPGERLSNMAPPTMCIVALVLLQAGIALLVRPWVTDRLEHRARWARANDVVNRFALPLYLFHSTGMALWFAFTREVVDWPEKRQPDLRWWIWRPFSVVGPLLMTLPVILLFGRRYVKRGRRPAAAQTA